MVSEQVKILVKLKNIFFLPMGLSFILTGWIVSFNLPSKSVSKQISFFFFFLISMMLIPSKICSFAYVMMIIPSQFSQKNDYLVSI